MRTPAFTSFPAPLHVVGARAAARTPLRSPIDPKVVKDQIISILMISFWLIPYDGEDSDEVGADGQISTGAPKRRQGCP
ncbi:hypothetical protein GCM10017786_07460 [Amycolatopsis deserti]|uniref:Uncharacterized protein n=1 Tax=Amycolatopsis deserti TaxID=185696 RepID=A0ABQ3IG20_9PSEU|nr:hypothetical protein GCM10017786_07460 [Amycolatopsis deserti]